MKYTELMNEKDTLILLTACISPQGMAQTLLQDPLDRLAQYRLALAYYLDHTPYKVVCVENTLTTDLGEEFATYIEQGRLEYLTFQGNSFDKSLGKGYGEALIIKYAMDHALFVRSARYIIKITGRVIIKNINQLCRVGKLSLNKKQIVACNVRPSKGIASSVFFICEKHFFSRFFLPEISRIDEQKNSWFEHVLFYAIQKCKEENYRNLIFSRPIEIEGISGTHNRVYPPVKWTDYILSFVAAFLYNRFNFEKF